MALYPCSSSNCWRWCCPKRVYIYIFWIALQCVTLQLQLGSKPSDHPAAVAWYDHPGEDRHDPSARNCASSHLGLPKVGNDRGVQFSYHRWYSNDEKSVEVSGYEKSYPLQSREKKNEFHPHTNLLAFLPFPVTNWSTTKISFTNKLENRPKPVFPKTSGIRSGSFIHPWNQAAKSNFLGFVLVESSCTWTISHSKLTQKVRFSRQESNIVLTEKGLFWSLGTGGPREHVLGELWHQTFSQFLCINKTYGCFRK